MKTPLPLLVLTGLSLVPCSLAFAADERAALAGSDDVQRIVEHVRHAIVVGEGRARAANPGQRWTTRFDSRGALTTPNDGGWSWGLELTEVRFGDTVLDLCAEPRTSIDGGRIEYAHDELLAEWYVNDARGLEHGFDVQARPADASGRLELVLAVRGDLAPLVDASGRNVAFLDTRGAAVLRYDGLVAFDARGTLLDARFTGDGANLRLVVDDRAASYPITIDPIAQQAFLKASNPGQNDNFGATVDLSGDTLVVGAPHENSSATGVDGNQNDESAPDAGAAYVFVRGASGWTQQAYLKSADVVAVGVTGGDRFGSSVAIEGDTIVVGVPFEDSESALVGGDPTDNSSNDTGAAYVFERVGSTWTQTAYLKSSLPTVNEALGTSVAIDGDTIVVGGRGSGSGQGTAQIYVRNGGTWSHQARLTQVGGSAGDGFGSSVAIDGDTLAVGTPSDDNGATGVNATSIPFGASGSGAAYVFVRTGSTWNLEAYVKASNTGVGDSFGSWVALHADTLAVAAPAEDSNATGVGGNQANNAASDSGAVYLFERSGAAWSQVVYLKPSNTNAGDFFGFGLALSASQLAVGAGGDDSAAVGLGGNPFDNSLPGAGAVHLFQRSGSSVTPLAFVKSSWPTFSAVFGAAVALDGTTLVVGELGNSLDASGAAGGASLLSSGAAYTFDLDTVRTKLGCTGNQGQLSTDDFGLYLGTPFQLDFATTLPAGVAILAYGIDGTNIIGCGTFLPGLGEVLLGLVNTPTILQFAPVVGTATFTLPVPPNANLAGIEIGFQAFALDGLGGAQASNLLLDRLSF